MPNYKNQEELINSFRVDYPTWSYPKSDEEIYNIWADENRKAGKTIPDYVKPSISSIDMGPTGFKTLPKKEGSPQDFEDLDKMGTSMLARGISEIGVEEGFMGASSDFYKNSFNQSFAGLYYQSVHGKPKYELSQEDYKLDGFLAEAGSYMLGMLNPIDAGVFAASMGSSVLARGGFGVLTNLGKKAFATSAVKGQSGLTTSLVGHAIEGGFGLGTYGAGHAALASAADQRTKTGEVDVNKVAEDASDAFLESFMIGAPAGLIGRGALGGYYATKKMAEKPLTSLPRMATGLPGQYATELATFAALPSLYKSVGLESYKDYPMMFSEEWNKMLAMDAGMSAPLFFGPVALKKIFNKRVKIAEDTKLEFEEAKLDKTTESFDNMEINSMGFDLGPDFSKQVAEHASIKKASKSEVAKFKQDRERLQSIYETAQGNPESVVLGDRSFVVSKDGQAALAHKKGILQDLVNNPNELADVANIIKSQEGKTGEATALEVAALKSEFESTIQEIDKSKKDFTDFALGVRKAQEPKVEKVSVASKTTSAVKADISGTPEQVVKFYENTVASIKKDIKIEKDRIQIEYEKGNIPTRESGFLQNLQGQLKGAGFQLSAAKKVLKDSPVEPTPKAVDDIPGIKKSVEEFRATADDASSQVSKRIKKLANMQELMEAEKPFTSPKEKANYEYNQEIITRIMQQTLPFQKGTKGPTAGSYIKDYASRVEQMNAFSKHVVKEGFSFKNVTDDVVRRYAADAPIGHKTAIAQLVGKLTGPYKSKNLTLDAGEITAAAKPEVPEVRAGVLSDKQNTVIGSESIAMTLSKQAATGPQEKYITKKTAKILKKLQKDSDKTLSKYLFNDKEGYALGNAEANALAEKIFGAKPGAVANSPARAFRKALLTWAQKKYKGTTTPETELIKREVLKDKSNTDKITEAYGKADFKKEAKKLVNQFLKDIKNAKGTAKEKQTYSIQEIKKGLATDFSKDIIIKTKGKEKVIPGDVAEGFARYLVEAGPRINEIVPGRRRPSGEFQRQPIGAPAGVKEMQRILREEIAKNPNVRVKTNQDMDAAGMFADGVIYINLKKANAKTWYHENSHRLKDLIDKTGNKDLQKVWKRGEKIFAKDAKLAKQPLSEFIPDEIMRWADNQSATPTLASKMKTWTEQLWSSITKVFFGKDFLTKADVRRLLGERVLKGFEDIPDYRKAVRNSEGMPQYQFASVEERAKSVKKEFDFAVKASGGMTRATRKGVFEHIASQAGIENFKDFKLTGKNLSETDIIKFKQQLDEIPFEDIARVAKIQDAYKTVQEIQGYEKDFIDPKTRAKMLNFFGVKANNLYQLANDVSAANKYKDFLLSVKHPDVSKSGSYLLERVVQSDNNLPNSIVGEFERPGAIKKWMMRTIYSGHSYLGAIGGKTFKTLEKKLLQHASSEFRHVANFVVKFEEKVTNILGKNWDKGFGKDMGVVLDKQALLERLDLDKLTASQKQLVKKVYKSDAIQIKDGKHAMNKKYNYKARFKDRPANAADNPELAATYVYFDFTNNVQKEFNKVTRKSFETDAEHKEYIDSKPVNFLTNEVYVRYQLSKPMLKVMDRLGDYQEKFISNEALKIQNKMALDKYGTKAKAENLAEFEVEAFEKANRLFAQMQKYGESYKISDSFFKNRNEKLPEFLEIDGKNIEVYDRSYGSTKAYGLGVAKALATIEHFPERYNIKMKVGAEHLDSQQALIELQNKSPEFGDTASKIIDRQLGEYGSYNEAAREIGRRLNNVASIFAKTALGFPTSGAKNFILGQIQNIGFLNFRTYMGGMIDAMNSDFRANARLTGLTEVGLRHVDDITLAPKLWDAVFKVGGMRPTENANRYIIVAGAKRYAKERIDVLHHKNFSDKSKSKATDELKSKFFLNDEQIKLLKTYGNKGLVGHKFKNNFDKSKVKLELENIEQQISTYAHINTQGASTSLFQPVWANGPLAKPLTLFWRMAYAASENTTRNVKLAYKHGDYARLATIGLAPFIGGYALAAMNNYVLGSPMPKENSNHGTWIKHLLVQGETLGVATSIYSFMDGEAAEMTIYPAMINWTYGFVDAIRATKQGKKTALQSTEDFLKSISSGYRNSIKVLEKINNPYKIKYNKYRTLKYDYLDEMYPNKTSNTSYQGNDSSKLGTRSDLYRDFKTVFMSGNVDDIAKQYVTTMFTLAADMQRQSTPKDGALTLDDFQIFLKKAVSQLDGDITSFHPNPYDLDKKYSGSNKKLNEEVRANWYKWLAKDEERVKVYAKELKSATNDYNAKIMGLNKHIDKYLKDPELLKQAKKSVRRHLKSNTIVFY